MEQKIIHFVTETYERLRKSTDAGASGVMKIEGNAPGPCVCISVCTHGNEPSGLYGVGKLIEYINSRQTPIAGTLLLVLNNLEATSRYIASLNGSESGNFRYIDVNMNRLPIDVLTKQPTHYEEFRAQELKSIWEKIEYALDIHSTTLESVPFIVNPKPVLAEKIVAGLPINKVIINTDSYASGYPAIHFYGTENNPAQTIGIECGSHEDENAFAMAEESIFSFLNHTKTISTSRTISTESYELYKISASIYRPDTSYQFTREFANFEFIPADTILLKGDGPDVILKKACHSFFVSSLEDTSLTEEVMFLSKPVERIKLN